MARIQYQSQKEGKGFEELESLFIRMIDQLKSIHKYIEFSLPGWYKLDCKN